MRRLVWALLIAQLLLSFCIQSTYAQSSADFGVKLSASDNNGNANPNAGITGNVILRFGDNVIDATGDFVIRSVKIQTNDGKAVSTKVLYRRYLVGPVYAVTGFSAVHLMTNLFAETATNALVGGGVEIGNVRVQATWAAPDFTSIHEVSAYDVLLEYRRPFGKERKYYVAFRPSAEINRFTQQRGVSSIYDILTGYKVGMSVSVGRTF